MGDDPMARDDDRHRIGTQRVADRPRIVRATNAARDPFIGTNSAVWDPADHAPHPPLECGSLGQVHREVQLTPTPYQIRCELLLRLLQGPL